MIFNEIQLLMKMYVCTEPVKIFHAVASSLVSCIQFLKIGNVNLFVFVWGKSIRIFGHFTPCSILKL